MYIQPKGKGVVGDERLHFKAVARPIGSAFYREGEGVSGFNAIGSFGLDGSRRTVPKGCPGFGDSFLDDRHCFDTGGQHNRFFRKRTDKLFDFFSFFDEFQSHSPLDGTGFCRNPGRSDNSPCGGFNRSEGSFRQFGIGEFKLLERFDRRCLMGDQVRGAYCDVKRLDSFLIPGRSDKHFTGAVKFIQGRRSDD